IIRTDTEVIKVKLQKKGKWESLNNLYGGLIMFINGKWRTTKEKLSVCNPATGSEVFSVNYGSSDHVKEAIKVAESSFQKWSKYSDLEREDILLKICKNMEGSKEVLAQVITKEMGKPINDARGETQSAI